MKGFWTCQRPGLFVLWLGRPWRLGPWPLYRWGTRVGYAFDLGGLRVGLRFRKDPE